MHRTATTDLALRAEVEQFLFREAGLLDDKRYADWVDLFTEDAIYWVPANAFDVDPTRHVSIIYDDHPRLKERLARMQHSNFWAQDPASRLSRLIGNVRLLEADDEELLVESRFQMLELRRGKSRQFAGTYQHGLVRGNGDFRIRAKTVFLLNNDEPQLNLTFLL